jgi:hypothetical protein
VATVPRDAQRQAVFSVPFSVANLEKTRQLRCLVLPGRDLSRCLIQVIAEGDHHFSFSHTYRCPQLPESGFAFTVPLHGEDAYWKSLGHGAPWTGWERTGLRRLEVKVFFPDPVAGTRLELRYQEDLEAEGAARLAWCRAVEDSLPLGKRYELAFDIAGWTGNPFNYNDLPLVLAVTAPDGTRQRVHPFMYQGFEAISLLDKEGIRPVGPKQFRARYRPLQIGPHRYRLTAGGKDDEERVLGEGQFLVTPGTPPGFLSVSKRSPHFFETREGRFVYLAGWNFPYPVDQPYGEQYVPYLPTESSLAMTRKMLDDLADSGGNFIRFWLSDWWNGLEWSSKVDNYSGIGRYNLKHAWLNDQVVQHCEKRGIYMQWETLNHVRLKPEYGWPQHPYNVSNGGFLSRGREFWTNPEVRKWSENRLTYIAARYADSPTIHSWNLMSEPDQVSARWGVWNEAKAMLISQMKFMQGQDPYQHITSSHMCLPDQDVGLFTNDTLQFVNSNAYQGLGGLSGNQIEAVRQFSDRYSQHGRPILIAECVGFYAGDPAVKMRRDTLGALWAGIASNLAGTPMSWWWNFNYGEDLGRLYRVAVDFMKGEDLIAEDVPSGQGWVNRDVQVTSQSGNLRALMVGSPTRRFLFAYNFDTLSRTRRVPSVCTGNRVSFASMAPGEYGAEFWDLRNGKSTHSEVVTVGVDGMAVLQLPEFTEGWAIKIATRNGAVAQQSVSPGAVRTEVDVSSHQEGSPGAAPYGTPSEWSWRIQPLVECIAPAARERSLVDVRIALPEACSKSYPQLTDRTGAQIPFTWEALDNGSGWRLRVAATQFDRGAIQVSAVSTQVAGSQVIDEEGYGLRVTVASARTFSMNSQSQFERDFARLSRKKVASMAQIDQLENPLGDNENFLALYQGPLLAPSDGLYEFASNSDDASYVMIDGQEVVPWTGGRGMDMPNRPMANSWRSRGQIRLKRGVHWVEYGHRQNRGACLARLGWRPPPSTLEGSGWAMPFDEGGDIGFQVVPEWAFDGILPSQVDVQFKGRTVASLVPSFGLELRRPAKRIFTVALGNSKHCEFRFFTDAGVQQLDVNGQTVPVWAWNNHWRPFSMEWEQCADRRGLPMLKTMLYDMDMPLSVTFAGESAIAKPTRRRVWMGWAPVSPVTNRAFTIAMGPVTLVKGMLEEKPRDGSLPGGVSP